jgi:hypothetical protein
MHGTTIKKKIKKKTREERIGRNLEQGDIVHIYDTKPEISWRNRGKQPDLQVRITRFLSEVVTRKLRNR